MEENNKQSHEETDEDGSSEILELLRIPDISSAIKTFAESNRMNISNTGDANQRRQWASYFIVGGIVFGVSLLTYHGMMGESAAAGIYGAVVGHIFSRVNTGGK